jgi:hypothetical protein
VVDVLLGAAAAEVLDVEVSAVSVSDVLLVPITVEDWLVDVLVVDDVLDVLMTTVLVVVVVVDLREDEDDVVLVTKLEVFEPPFPCPLAQTNWIWPISHAATGLNPPNTIALMALRLAPVKELSWIVKVCVEVVTPVRGK